MNDQSARTRSSFRIHIWYAFIVFLLAVCMVRLFYLQIIKHEYYKTSAQSDQYKEYEISASRGLIKAYDGDNIVPIVLSHELFTIYADPQLVKDHEKTAATLQSVLGGDVNDYLDIIKREGRYQVLAKKLDESKKQKILAKKLPGIGSSAQNYRTYPQGILASQLLGFVDDAGKGRYGIEQALNSKLTGKPGMLKAVTDASGVPLAASHDNIRKAPEHGQDVVLTIDIGMQKQVEQLLKQGLDHARSGSGSVVVMDAKTGAVKAMANYPTYDPANYTQVEDGSVFNNAAVTEAIEVGSVMKPLTAAAALNLGVVNKDSTFYDSRRFQIDDAIVTNVEEDGGAGVKDIKDILNLSLNTGATWLVMQMGKGDLNKQARETWHNYMVDKFRFGEKTGIEQSYEEVGYIPSPVKGDGLNITYANTSFGQAMTATTLQMAGAFAAILNGGTYYQPHLVAATVDAQGDNHKTKPKVLAKDVVSPNISQFMQEALEYVVDNHRFSRKFDNSRYSAGGKTGTAQIADPAGGYLENDFNGTYTGFVGGDDPEYIISIRIDRPKIPGYAGSQAAQPLFGTIGHMLIDNFNVPAKTR